MTKRKSAGGLPAAALFAAMTAVLAQIQIPLPGVPVNMALFAVHLGAMLLGPRRAAWAAAVYLFMGLCGAPVFAGFSSGPAALFGPTGGFLLSYPLCALVTGRLCAGESCAFWRRVLSGLAGILVCGAAGILWFLLYTNAAPTPAFFGWWLIYLPGDLIKVILAALLARRLSVPLRRLGL